MMKIKTGKRAFAALIAVVMVLGMFPLAALADGNTVTIDTTEGTGTTYDPVAKSIILKAEISEASADVTVLAIKCDSEITLAELNALAPAEIANKIAYINQVESDSEGKVNMTFKLRELDGDYVTVAVGGEGVAEPKVCSFSTKRAAATFDVADYYIAGEEIAFNVTDANGWIAATKAVKVDGVVVESGVLFEGTTMTLGDPSVFALVDELGEPVAEKTFALTIETEEHSTISKEIKVVAPTKVAYDELAAEGALTVDYAGGDMAEGAATVTLPAATYAGATVTWAITPDATIDAGVAALPRAAADSAEPNTVYTLTATIEANGYKTLEKVYTATVNRLGLAGVEVGGSVDLGIAPEVAAGATITVAGTPVAAKPDGSFELGMLSPGTYEFVVGRPGYVTFTYSVEIGAEGITAVNGEAKTALEVTMVAGDLVGDDGVIGFDDFMAFGAVYLQANEAADFDASGTVDFTDFMTFGANYLYNRDAQ